MVHWRKPWPEEGEGVLLLQKMGRLHTSRFLHSMHLSGRFQSSDGKRHLELEGWNHLERLQHRISGDGTVLQACYDQGKYLQSSCEAPRAASAVMVAQGCCWRSDCLGDTFLVCP